MNKKAMFSSGNDEWETPQDLFDKLNQIYNFTLDPCATKNNYKCDKYYTIEDDGLSRDWQGERVFCNPPYSRKTRHSPGQEDWIKKCYMEAQKPNTTCVMLLPARTDTKAFHEFIYKNAEIQFIKGRLKFGGSKDNAPFPSMIVIFSKNKRSFDNDHE